MPVKHVEPPRATQVELRVISALTHLCDPDKPSLKIQQAMLNLDAECFYSQDHQEMFGIIANLFQQRKEFSFLTFCSLLPDRIYNIVHDMLKDDYCTPHFLETDIQQLLYYRQWRKELKILIEAVNYSFESKTPQESLQEISSHLQRLSTVHHLAQNSHRQTTEQILENVFNRSESESSYLQVDIPGLPEVPQRSMITIAGRSGHGKTFFALHLMDKIIEMQPDKHALYFNLEMDPAVMLERLAILNGFGKGDQIATLNAGAASLLSKNLTLVTKDLITIEEIETESRLSALQNPLSVIVVDYLGLISSKRKAERHDLQQSDIAKRLAALAMSLDCIVLLLIQVNREAKNRPVGQRCPTPFDAAESMGSVHSSSWWLGIDQPQNDDSNSPEWFRLFQVECRKNRGKSGMFKLNLNFENGMFGQWTQSFSSNYQKREPNVF